MHNHIFNFGNQQAAGTLAPLKFCVNIQNIMVFQNPSYSNKQQWTCLLPFPQAESLLWGQT